MYPLPLSKVFLPESVQKGIDSVPLGCNEKVFLKRTTLIIEKSVIKKVFYPIFPLNKHINEVMKWLKIN